MPRLVLQLVCCLRQLQPPDAAVPAAGTVPRLVLQLVCCLRQPPGAAVPAAGNGASAGATASVLSASAAASRRCTSSARWASRSTRRRGAGTTRLSGTASVPSSTRSGRRKRSVLVAGRRSHCAFCFGQEPVL